jgi:predicted enzyme related to lactoylglutathione lyase
MSRSLREAGCKPAKPGKERSGSARGGRLHSSLPDAMLVAVKPRIPVVLGLVLLLGGAGLAFGAYASYRDQRSGIAGTAKVTSCSGHDGRYASGVHCTGSWVVGGSLLAGGRVVIGDITNADRGDVGNTIDVRIHGDSHATKPDLGVSIVLGLLGIPMLMLGLYLLFVRYARPPEANTSVPAGLATLDGGPFGIPGGGADLAAFYCAVFGWSATSGGDLAAPDGEVVARLRPGAPVASDSVIATIAVDDLEGTLRRARDAGGSTRGAVALSSDALISFAIFYDPAANAVSIFTPSPHRGDVQDDVSELVAAGRWEQAADAVDRLWPSGPGVDPHGYNIERKAAWWEARGDELRAAEPYERASRLLTAYAAGATSGGEGYARMQDVQRVADKITALRHPTR